MFIDACLAPNLVYILILQDKKNEICFFNLADFSAFFYLLVPTNAPTHGTLVRTYTYWSKQE